MEAGEEFVTSDHVVTPGDLLRRLAELEAERDEARDWVRRMHNDRQVLTCAFCGQAYPPGTAASSDDALAAHIRVCPKHPMREAEARVRELESALSAMVDAAEEMSDCERTPSGGFVSPARERARGLLGES
ncbi:MAG: hypothetical protein ACYTBJ_01770 [Planctomycetota bacterium]|jgi:hypothetical protein